MKIDTDKINHIIAALEKHIVEAALTPSAPWHRIHASDSTALVGTRGQSPCFNPYGENMAAFIAHARTLSPLACQSLKIAIEHILFDVDCNSEDCSCESHLPAIRTLNEIAALWPDEA